MRHQSFLTCVHALGEADLLAFQFAHPVDVVPGTDHHAAAFVWSMRHAQQSGPTDVRVNVDGRKQTTEADEVVQVVDVVRIPVVFARRSQEGVLHADLLELFPRPAQFLVDIAGGYEWTIRVVHLFPIKLDGI